MLLRALIVGGALIAASASAESIYGIEMGAPLRLPECPVSKLTPKADARYTPFTNELCVRLKTPGAPRSEENQASWIVFPYADQPAHSKGNLVGVFVLEGIVQVLVVSTAGEPTQLKVFEDLQARFGTPSNSSTVPFQNRMGATFQGLVANWDRGDALQVEFFGMASRIDSGQIVFGTKAGVAERARRMTEASKTFSGRPL